MVQASKREGTQCRTRKYRLIIPGYFSQMIGFDPLRPFVVTENEFANACEQIFSGRITGKIETVL
jgi:hypothetical protein